MATPAPGFFDDWFTLAHPIIRRDENFSLNYLTPQLPIASVILYLAMLYFLPKFMANRKPFSCKFLVAAWNLGLSIFSVCVFFGVAIPYFGYYIEFGWYHGFCGIATEHLIFSEKRIGIVFWAYIFAVSKYFELFDTLFLIIRKKPVTFLHWFHHATVLLYTWYAEYTHFTIGLLFIIVNSFVHTFMYYYYFLAEIGRKPSERIAFAITVIQISQMVVGIATVSLNYYLWAASNYTVHCTCDAPLAMMIAGVLMYGAYLFLFLQFFIKRYFMKRPTPAGGRKPTDTKSPNTKKTK